MLTLTSTKQRPIRRHIHTFRSSTALSACAASRRLPHASPSHPPARCASSRRLFRSRCLRGHVCVCKRGEARKARECVDTFIIDVDVPCHHPRRLLPPSPSAPSTRRTSLACSQPRITPASLSPTVSPNLNRTSP